jgi:DNA topoisomerase-1
MATASTVSTNGVAVPDAVRDVGLQFSSDQEPGIRRARRGRGFHYVDEDGVSLGDTAVIKRIKRLAIPPAWIDVWICPRANGHIQATGRDERGRKQYIYHPGWRAHREQTKYEHLLAFGKALPSVRRRIARDLKGRGLSREKVLAVVIHLLDETHLRIGNDEYARANNSFGLTTLRDRHVVPGSNGVRFRFRGKSGRFFETTAGDRRLARIVRQCQDLPGQRLFQYQDDDGVLQGVTSADVNAYLREITGDEFSAKEFRTWAGTVIAASVLRHQGPPDSEAEANRAIVATVDEVAGLLGNTRAIARASYIHPAVLDAFTSGRLQSLDPGQNPRGLNADERVVLALLGAAR